MRPAITGELKKRELEKINMKVDDVESRLARSRTLSIMSMKYGIVSRTPWSRRSARVQQETNSALVIESPLANSVLPSWPSPSKLFSQV